MKKLALLLVLVMLFGVTAFAATPTGENEYPLADEIVELKVWVGQPADSKYHYDDCTMTKYMEEKMGIKINLMYHTGDGNTFYNTLLASDPKDWPDVLLGIWFSTSQIEMGIEAGLLLPLNDLIDEYGYNYKIMLEEQPGYKKMLTAPDGNIYTFVYTDCGVHKACEYKQFVYADWLKKLDIELPTTIDEYKDMLIRFRDEDPNGNGIADEIPVMGYYNGRKSDPICFLMNPFELYTDNFYTISDDGEIVFHANTDGWREGLAYIADLYAEGLIAPETYVQDQTQFGVALTKAPDEVVVGVMAIWEQEYYDIDVLPLTAYVEAIPPLEGPAGIRQAAARFGGNFNMVGAISTACENPEVAFKFLDWFIGEEGLFTGHFGLEGSEWTWTDATNFNGENKSVLVLGDYMHERWNSGSFPRYDKPEARYATADDPSVRDIDNTYMLVHGNAAMEPFFVDHHTPDVVWCSDANIKNEKANLDTTIQGYIKEMDTKFIIGELDINDDAAWEEYLNGLEARNLDRWLEVLAVYYGL